MTSAETAWAFVDEFTKPIRQVGPALDADFMKNIGFRQFVKPDFHVLRQLPRVAGIDLELSAKDAFTVGWLIASALRVPAFTLDYTLYQWGRYGS